MKVLIACEESQEVCKAFRKMGHRNLLAGTRSGTFSATRFWL